MSDEVTIPRMTYNALVQTLKRNIAAFTVLEMFSISEQQQSQLQVHIRQNELMLDALRDMWEKKRA